jgi:hypothetical protein
LSYRPAVWEAANLVHFGADGFGGKLIRRRKATSIRPFSKNHRQKLDAGKKHPA